MTVVGPDELEFRDFPGRSTADPFKMAGRGASTVRQVVIEHVPTRSPHLHPQSEEIVYAVLLGGAKGMERSVSASRASSSSSPYRRRPLRSPRSGRASVHTFRASPSSSGCPLGVGVPAGADAGPWFMPDPPSMVCSPLKTGALGSYLPVRCRGAPSPHHA